MKKRTAVRMITYLSAAALVFGVFAYICARRARAAEYYMRANTSHAFEELVTGMSDLSTSLKKSMYVTDPILESALCTQIFGNAVSAQMAMGVLPFASQNLEQTAGFLAQVGDYACVLSKTVGTQGGFNEESIQNLRALSDMADIMTVNLQDMQSRLNAGELRLDDIVMPDTGFNESYDSVPLAGETFQMMEEEFPELPTLIYDGPFSQGHKKNDPVMLRGTEFIGEAQAKTKCADFIGEDEENIAVAGEIGGNIPCYVCTTGDYTVYVTKQGGMVMSLLRDGAPGVRKLSPESALACADKIMKSVGYENMKRSYYIVQGNTLTANYEYSQDGITIYPDLVKIGIALDDGSLVSYDASGYISSHYERELPEILVSEEEAADSVSNALSVRKQGIALIPTDSGEECLCHEILCENENGENCIIYTNVQSGAQERILLLLEDDNGTLTL